MPYQESAGTGFHQCHQCTAMHRAKVIGVLCARRKAEQETAVRCWRLQADELVEGNLGEIHAFIP